MRVAIGAYKSDAWINKQEWINVGKVNVQVPGFLKDAGNIDGVRSVLKVVLDRILDANTKAAKNDTARAKAAKSIWSQTKSWKPEEKKDADLKPLLANIPDAMSDPVDAAGLKDLNVSTSGMELPVVSKKQVKDLTALMEMITNASDMMFRNENLLPESLSWEEFEKNQFLVKSKDETIYNLIGAEGDELGCSKITSAYSAKLVPVASFLEMWLLRSTK